MSPHSPKAPIRQLSHQLPCWWLHCFLFQRWSDAWCPFCSFIKYWWVGRWARFGHFCSKIYHHSNHTNTHPQVTLNNSILPLERTPCIMGVIFWSSLQIQYPCQIFSHPGLTPYQHPQGPYWYQLGSTKRNHTYHLYVTYPVSFHVCSSHLVPRHLWPQRPLFRNSKLIITLPSS